MLMTKEHIGQKIICISNNISGDRIFTLKSVLDDVPLIRLMELDCICDQNKFVLASDYFPELPFEHLSKEKKLILIEASLVGIILEYRMGDEWLERVPGSTYFAGNFVYRFKPTVESQLTVMDKLEKEFSEASDKASELFATIQELKQREISNIN